MNTENREILNVVESLSNAKGVSKAVIVEAIETALALVTAKRYQDEVSIRVEIDTVTGRYQTFRRWEVIADDAYEGDDDSIEDYLPGQQLILSEAVSKYDDASLKVGEWVEEQVESVDFGRIAAQQAKQIILQKVREAEREKIKALYSNRIGELIVAAVKRVTRDFLVLDLGDSAEALLPRSNLVARENFRLNDRVRVILEAVREEPRGPHVLATRTSPDFLIELFKIEVPEIGDEVIEIRSAARDPGLRAKIAVKTNDGRIDPVGACVGMRGSRVQAVSNELNGERVDIVLWDDNPAQYVLNAMKPADISSIVVDEDNGEMDLAVTEDQLSLAIGRQGQNVRLASDLTGWKLNLMSESEAAKKHESESERIQKKFVTELDVEDDVALLLVSEGFTSIESIANLAGDEKRVIKGLDDESVAELSSRAQDALLIAELADTTEPEADLLALEGVSSEMADSLAQNGVVCREDLAEMSVDELLEIVPMDAENAGELIMKARAHWFASE